MAASLNALQMHMSRFHNAPNGFECNVCHHVFWNRAQYSVHANKAHADSGSDDRSHRSHNKKVACHLCGKIMSSRANHLGHMHFAHGAPREFQCEHCGMEFVYAYKMKAHVMSVHGKNL